MRATKARALPVALAVVLAAGVLAAPLWRGNAPAHVDVAGIFRDDVRTTLRQKAANDTGTPKIPMDSVMEPVGSPPPPKAGDPPPGETPGGTPGEGNGGTRDPAAPPTGKPDNTTTPLKSPDPTPTDGKPKSSTVPAPASGGNDTPTSNKDGATSGGSGRGQNSNSNAGTAESSGGKPTKNKSQGGVLSTPAIAGIGAGAGVLAIAVLALIIVGFRKRSVARSNSYFHFPDADEASTPKIEGAASVVGMPAGSGGAAAAAIARKASGGPPSPPPPPEGGVVAVDGGSGSSPPPPPAVRFPGDSTPRAAQPTAPTVSQFSRRDSVASSASSDTIVAPEFGTVQSTGTMPPYWHS